MTEAPGQGHKAAHTWHEARQRAFDVAAPIPPSPVPLKAALGRTLASDAVAIQDMPHYASSAMDGWAVNGTGPWILVEPGHRLAPHRASPIVTGAPFRRAARLFCAPKAALSPPTTTAFRYLRSAGPRSRGSHAMASTSARLPKKLQKGTCCSKPEPC